MKRLNMLFFFTSFVFMFFFMSNNKLSAQMDNVVVSPPPIPWYEFNKGQVDFKVGGSLADITSDYAAISGAGINLTPRYAFADMFAVDFMFNYLFISAVMDDGSSADAHFLSWNPNLEFQVINTDKYNLIFFAGYMWVMVPGTYWDSGGGTLGVTIHMDGIQFGGQFAYKAGNFSIAPFFLFQSMSGDVLVGDTWSDVPTQSVMTFGFDITWIPYGITLSGLLQSVTADSDMTVIYIALSHNFQWGAAEKPQEDTTIKPVKETKKKTNKKTK